MSIGLNNSYLSTENYSTFASFKQDGIKLFDITLGLHKDFNNYASTLLLHKQKNYNYRTFANILESDFDNKFYVSNTEVNATGIIEFDKDIVWDGIKPGSFSLLINRGNETILLVDREHIFERLSMSRVVKDNKGRWGYLFSETNNKHYGLIYYDYGVIIIDILSLYDNDNTSFHYIFKNVINTITYGSIYDFIIGFTGIINHISFTSTKENKSNIYICIADYEEFNFTNNKSNIKNGEMKIRNNSYITSIGLYDNNNELLATGKTSVPVKKNFNKQLFLKLKLNF